jgi:membrane-bound serine protease (ClpP class)
VRRLAAALAALILLTARLDAVSEPAPEPEGQLALARVVVDGPINPAVAAFLGEAIERAHGERAPALVIQLDTPGGLLPSTRAIVKDVLGAPLPVIVWVAPRGARAHPVGGQGEDIKGALGEKIESFTASFSEAIARQRGRNVEWAARAVRESVSIDAEEAARTNVVDFVAKDLDELVTRAQGRRVEVAGEKRELDLAGVRRADGGVRTRTCEMRLGQRVLNVIADPNIAYLLMMAGLLGLYIEFTNPGFGFPGVAGAISLLLGLTALHVLPVNTSGLVLILLGLALLVAEAFVPTFGLLGAGGLVAFVIGSLFLFDGSMGVAVSRSVVFAVGGTVGAIMLVIATLVVRAHRRPAALGVQGMIGTIGVARSKLAPAGTVLVNGEYWTAESDEAVEAGERVEVTDVQGLKLRVRRVRPESG